MNVIDMFCGCGGMGLGFTQAGHTIVQAFDFDKYAVQSYRHNLGDCEQWDITKVQPEDLKEADIWTFGFPCQDLSVAGNMKGLYEGKRSGLFFEVMRLLDGVTHKPHYLLAENVSGLKPYLPVLKEEFNKHGYVMSYRFYNSKYWGVPQSRPRYFVIGVRKDLFIKGKLYFPVEDQSFVPKLSTVLEINVDEKYYIADEKARAIIEEAMKRANIIGTHACLTPHRPKRQNGRRAKEEEEPMFTLTRQDIHGVIESAATEEYIEPKVMALGNTNPSGRGMNGYVYDSEGLAPCCTTNKGEGNKILVPVGFNRNDGIVSEREIARCLSASDYRGINRQQTSNAVVEIPQFRVRKLTPREFARLQGFPDSYEIVVSNSQAYKQFGNAVTVNVAKAIGECLN